MTQRSVKRTIYDSVFTNLFGDPKYQLMLYQELHPEDTATPEEELKTTTLESVLLNQMYNDLGILVKDKLIFLLEAQSTWSPNIAIRSLMYLGETYLDYLQSGKQNYYGETPVRLPKPELYVLYTGEKQHIEKEISLADTHWNGDNSVAEIKVKVLYGDGKNTILSQYVAFTKVFKEKRALFGATERAVTETIDECIGKGILSDYLLSKRTEVISIMLALYNKDVIQDIYGESKKAEGRAEEREENIAFMLENGMEEALRHSPKYTDEEIDHVKAKILQPAK